ncbi:alpha/beta hydrolase [Jatrophihabitans sp.]|jgi:enterochelin esterase family protein|uniref:alpha/beta hydrolase n=1 Tax=Jatrophihabitans sp. TaxID=1932789 RepID=UPI002EFB8142
MTTIATPAGPVVDALGVTLRLQDRHARLRGVRLAQDIRIPGDRLDFSYRRGWWTLRVQRPAVDRMEYLLELRHPNEGRETIPDPGNPFRVGGAFGDKSVIEFPGYRRPAWLDLPVAPATVTDLAIGSRQLGSTVRGRLWSAEALAADEPAPLLVAHDGPEYDSLAGLTAFTGALIQAGRLPPLRVALLAPGDRNRWYAVNPSYARAVAGEVLPALAEQAPSTVRIGAGASLGALAMLHIHRLFPDSFGGLFLQSGSFFDPELDAHERRFARFGPVTRFVREVAQAVADPHPLPVSMTCGIIEENMANNQAMASALRRLGYPVEFAEVRDVHNYTAWRDAFDPHLAELIQTVAG